MIVVEVLLLIAALVLIVVTVELISRAWLKHRTRYYVFPPGLRIRIHPDREVFPKHPHTLNYVINSDGERGDEPPSSTDGLYRVLVAGGSQPEGYFLDQDTTWPAVVQRLLRRSERFATLGASTVHVGAIARSGVGSEGLDLILSRILPQYPRLQLVIIMVGATDVLRWIELGTPEVFPPVVVSDVFRCHPEGPFKWTPQCLAMTELIRRARRRWLRPVNVDDQAGRWIGRARTMRARATTVRAVIRDPAPMLDHFEHHFRRLLLSAKAHADRVLVVRQPWFNKACSHDEAASMWHGGVGQAWREAVTTYYSLEVFSKLMGALDARAAAVARDINVEQLDLMPVLEQSLRTCYDGLHVTIRGARQVADAVTAAILCEEQPRRSTPEGHVVVGRDEPSSTRGELRAS
ncbi:MAG TPA: hypothetical protein VKB50_04485 [Vicinamibacterales bacterium]|nr:hypothetical protein [Vicinamibacterales bacterium]